MRFAVGYRPSAAGLNFPGLVEEYAENISEVYFPYPGLASGRPVIDTNETESLISDLWRMRSSGAKLDLLLNGNCYGADAVSSDFEKRIVSIIDKLTAAACKPDIVTTTSPFIAHVIRAHDPAIELRASVNMRIATIQALDYASEWFDSFYICRDVQRDIGYVRKVSEYCHAKGKKLCMLLNSGCLRYCPAQSFHDNLIAHSREAEQKPDTGWDPHLCRVVYADPNRRVEILKASWIRPEDAARYEGIIDVFKLATRQHSHPRSVIGAYSSGRWDGNLLELLEPGFSTLFNPYMIDNSAFPEDFFEKSGACREGCAGCGYCEHILKQVLRRFDECFPVAF